MYPVGLNFLIILKVFTGEVKIMPFCENCGTQLTPNAKFCRSCGAKQAIIENAPATFQPQQAQPVYVPPPAPQPTPMPTQTIPVQAPVINNQQYQAVPQKTSSEQITGAIVLRKPKSFGRYDTFTGVVTNERFIIAQMTSDMVKDAAMQAKEQAKAEGKGFWGQWSDQLKASFGYTKRYLTMQPEAIIAETPGNFAINNNTIRELKLKIKHLDADGDRKEWEIEIHSTAGKYEYRMDENSHFVDLLKKAYPDRVKMPFGYFSKSININL